MRFYCQPQSPWSLNFLGLGCGKARGYKDCQKSAVVEVVSRSLSTILDPNKLCCQGETDDGRVEVTARGVTHSYRRLSELQFDSYRKCMSVIMKDIDEKIHVLSKGAETTMLEACVTGDMEKTEQQITSFASLRFASNSSASSSFAK